MRREFIDAEARAYLRFYYAGTHSDGAEVIRQDRTYVCDCGFETTAPGEIFDHCAAHAPKQYELPLVLTP